MPAINPQFAADLAADVYSLTTLNTLQEALDELNARYAKQLTFSEEMLLKAKTGGPWFIKCRTAFGFTLIGKGMYQGHAFLLFRGTQYLADWLTNLNITVSRSASG